MSRSVLLIEDDREMQSLIAGYLNHYGFEVHAFSHPKAALSALGETTFEADIIVLDLMLPDMDGFDVAKSIRKERDIPIIISSARGDIGNKIFGYEIGVDDYLEKPYEPRELVLRIEAVLRRFHQPAPLHVSDFEIDERAKSVTMDGVAIELTRVEFEVFFFLVQNRGKNVSREQIVNATSLEHETRARTVDMHVSNIRLKIGDDARDPRYIKSVWGIGYRFIG